MQTKNNGTEVAVKKSAKIYSIEIRTPTVDKPAIFKKMNNRNMNNVS